MKARKHEADVGKFLLIIYIALFCIGIFDLFLCFAWDVGLFGGKCAPILGYLLTPNLFLLEKMGLGGIPFTSDALLALVLIILNGAIIYFLGNYIARLIKKLNR